jgi:hypothetical protein
MFVNYFTLESIREYYKDKFEILLIDTYEEFDIDDSIVFIARKK